MAVYGYTPLGVPIDDEMVARIVAEAEQGYPGWKLQRGRRPLAKRAGASPARTFRLPADLDLALVQRAAAQHTTPSEVMREALYDYLATS